MAESQDSLCLKYKLSSATTQQPIVESSYMLYVLDMKYVQKSFTVAPGLSENYRNNYDETFRKDKKEEVKEEVKEEKENKDS